MFNGIYWHSDRFAVGYGLKLYHDVYGFADGEGLPWNSAAKAESGGAGHYLAVTYKF
jgi:nucleoside-specific channel-forming protein